MMRLFLLGTALLTTACGGGAASLLLSAGIPADVALRRGQAVEFGDEPLRIEFRDVLGDSRCPVDVVCVWEGDGEVELGVEAGESPTVSVSLHTTGSAGPLHVDLAGYTITLLALSPDPVSTDPIPPSAYVAHLRVERRLPD